MAIGIDGTLWAEGINLAGQLGDGSTLTRWFFDQVGTDTWMSVGVGSNRTVAVRADGTLWAWGLYPNAWFNSLGDGTNVGSSVPIQIGADIDWVMVAVGQFHNVALKVDGTLWAWGSNGQGQLGNGNFGSEFRSLVPTQIGTDTDWAYVSAGHTHTLAIKTDGSLWGWGANENGQLGNGTWVRQSAPVRIGIHYDWVNIDAGNSHSIGIRADGSLWAWGSNWSGALGIGTRYGKNVPMRVGTHADWVDATAGMNYTLGVRADGSLWVWGSTSSLRFRTINGYFAVPSQIHPYEYWASVSAGDSRVFAITEDGRIHRLGGGE